LIKVLTASVTDPCVENSTGILGYDYQYTVQNIAEEINVIILTKNIVIEEFVPKWYWKISVLRKIHEIAVRLFVMKLKACGSKVLCNVRYYHNLNGRLEKIIKILVRVVGLKARDLNLGPPDYDTEVLPAVILYVLSEVYWTSLKNIYRCSW
jgi:hypothetical protein